MQSILHVIIIGVSEVSSHGHLGQAGGVLNSFLKVLQGHYYSKGGCSCKIVYTDASVDG